MIRATKKAMVNSQAVLGSFMKCNWMLKPHKNKYKLVPDLEYLIELVDIRKGKSTRDETIRIR